MAGGNVIGSQKEMTAVINNLKETRVLDKALDTLTLEESYAVKLLDLDTKLIKLQYNRLENNVSKIKTSLKTEDISAMRTLEYEGKFKAESPIVVSTSHSKILAAAKRLKFNSNSYRRAISAMPRLEKHQSAAVVTFAPSVSPSAEVEVASSIQSTTPSRLSSRRHSIMGDHEEVAAVLCKRKARPHTSADGAVLLKRRQSAIIETPQRPSTAQILERIAAAQKARKNHSSQTLYSCHDTKSDNDPQIGGVFGPNPYELRRRRFLNDEHCRISYLAARQKQFVGDTTKFVKENPCVHNMRPETTEEVIRSIDSMTRRAGSKPNKSRQCNSIIELTDSANLLRQFAEIKKTRYLCIDDSLIDLSGVETLAKTQQYRTELWQKLNANSRVSFKATTAI